MRSISNLAALVITLVSAGAVTVLSVSPAHGAHGPAEFPHDFFAVVNADASLARGTPGTTVTHRGPGLYDVTFPGSVAHCAAVANLGYAGTVEQFTFPATVTVTPRGHTEKVDVVFPGAGPPTQPPHPAVLRDNAFHLHVDCGHALFANVNRDGTLRSASAGVTAGHHVAASGRYRLNFPEDISRCAPVATVRDGRHRRAFAVQAYLALGAHGQSLTVSVNRSDTKPMDWGFAVIVTCGEEPTAVFPDSNGFWNKLAVPEALNCAFTGSWYDPSPGATPSDQGYVSTWAFNSHEATIQTKNGGYGVQGGFGVDLVATC
jgi:hypothetical protein